MHAHLLVVLKLSHILTNIRTNDQKRAHAHSHTTHTNTHTHTHTNTTHMYTNQHTTHQHNTPQTQTPHRLEVGNLVNATEDRTHFGAWAIMSSPLILSFNMNDTNRMDRVWPIITNKVGKTRTYTQTHTRARAHQRTNASKHYDDNAEVQIRERENKGGRGLGGVTVNVLHLLVAGGLDAAHAMNVVSSLHKAIYRRFVR